MSKIKEKVFAVFGLGNFGKTVALVLAKRGGTVIAVDNKPEVIDDFKNKVSAAILIDSTDELAMAKAPLEDVDTAVIAIDNMETSIITTALLKKRGIPYILCRAVSPIHAQVLRQIGANEVVNLQEDEGTRIGTRLIAPEILDTIPITGECSLAEFYAPDMFIDKPVSELALEKKFNLHLSGVKRTKVNLDSEGNPLRTEQLLFPAPGDLLMQGDILILVGTNYDLDQFKISL
jgi:trk system potassium uptake protein